MLIFETLRPFVTFFQGCGFIPFALKIEQRPEKFAKFTFSFKYLVTWWYLLQLITQLFVTIRFSYLTGNIANALVYSFQNTSLIPVLLLVVVLGSHLFQLVIGRLILINYKHLRNAVEAIQEAESIIRKNPSSVMNDHFFTKHFVLPFVFVVVLVSMCTYTISNLLLLFCYCFTY